ncbi:AraC family transcriptional regulator [Mucilaginibacter mali]|uniref:AraC family transcriptional regulator n=1 Tax=Mucilaginibacter mali TaxID=2740462 RepID=A0A7D4Q1H3_9SPHI|nr:AraC family transcriptional regulator [Mucilaginibacter mali]QKJ28907.1 AraC family transcriptional regulator [Mucilaginibacter mali]
MKYSKTLRNNNTIWSDTTSHKQQTQYTNDFNIRFVFSGDEEYNIGRRKLTLYPDQFLILNKGTQYTSKIDSASPVESFSMGFDQGFLQDFTNSWQLNERKLLDRTSSRVHEYDFSETLYPFKGDIRFNVQHLKNYMDKGASNEILINEYMHHCLLNYYTIYDKEIYKKIDSLKFLNRSTKVEILRRLNLAKEYLLSNFNQNISLEELADHACLSVNHLLRTFKQAFHQSPHQFLMQTRLQRAKLLLKTTDYPINEIVNLVGFECPSSFIRLFKNRYDITPLKFRCSL